MELLADRDLASLLTFLRTNYESRDLEAYRSYVTSALPKLIHADITAYNDVDTRRQVTKWLFEPKGSVTDEEMGTFNRYAHQHPVIAHIARTNDSRALKISDFFSRARFHRLSLYNEFFRELGIESQMAATILSRRRIIGIALNRGRLDFSERERLLLNLLSPHLAQAYRNAAAMTSMTDEVKAMKRALEDLGSAVIVVASDGRIVSITSPAREMLTGYFGSWQPSNALPDAMRCWARHQRSGLDQLQVPEPLVVDKGGRRLSVRLVPERGQSLLLLAEQASNLRFEPFEAFGLTKREAEVLAWVAQGRTNSEIGSILSISARTVQKHLEHIFEKLAVETRTAAAARAWELIALPSPHLFQSRQSAKVAS
jgi:DNA-binding CsgD family transcriptional regulator